MKLLFCLPSHVTNATMTAARRDRLFISLPLGVLYLAAYLREKKWPGEMAVYDARLSGKVDATRERGERFGDSPDVMMERIRHEKPDVVAISNMFSSQIDAALEMATLAKRAVPKVVTVIGGPHASVFPLEMLAQESIDYVVMSEGEDRLWQLLLALERREEPAIQGVLNKPEDQSLLLSNKKVPVSFIQDLDTLPLPAYDMVDVERYFHLQSNGFAPRTLELGKRSVTILSSRGCPHQCVFCSIHITVGYKWRYHSPQYVKRHIDFLIQRYGIDFIHFEDDNFTHDTERYDRILDQLLTFNPPLPWDTPNGVRGDSWTLERVRRTKEAGCQHLVVAFESAVQEVLDKVVKKQLDLQQVDDLMRYCREVGIRLLAFYVIGLPGETEQDIRNTIDYSLDRFDRYNVHPVIHTALLLPGTELYNNVAANHYFEGDTLHSDNSSQIVTTEFNPQLLHEIYNEAMSRKMWLVLKKSLTSPQELLYNLKLISSQWPVAKEMLKQAFCHMRQRMSGSINHERGYNE